MSDRADERVTLKEAALLLGVHYSAVPKMVRCGDLAPRPNKRPSLSRQAVLGLRDVRAERARLPRCRRLQRRRLGRPDDEHEWVDAAAVDAHLNVGAAAVHQRARRGRLPFTLGSDGRTRFYRIDLVEMAVRAQEATRTKAIADGPASVAG